MDLSRRAVTLTQEYSLPLILGVFAGLIFGNIDPHLYHLLVDSPLLGDDIELIEHPFTIHFLIDGIFMVFFFGIAAQEITNSLLSGGP